MVAKEEGDDMIKDDEEREKCRKILLAIETEGGPKKASDALIKEADDLNMVVRGKGRWNYSLKANVLRREMMQSVAKGGKAVVALLKEDAGAEAEFDATLSEGGRIVDATICGMTVRARVCALVRLRANGLELVVLEHWRDGAWETLAVEASSLKEVDKQQQL